MILTGLFAGALITGLSLRLSIDDVGYFSQRRNHTLAPGAGWESSGARPTL